MMFSILSTSGPRRHPPGSAGSGRLGRSARWARPRRCLPASLEDSEEIAARAGQAAAHHPRERLALSTQRGFATELEGNQLTEADQRAKLQLVTGLAHRLWP
jgi:hypothetical protein